jgi:hypothetical protein
MFCRICIAYYMTENAIVKCSAIVSRVIQIGAQAEAPHEPRKSSNLVREAKGAHHDVGADAIGSHRDSDRALRVFNAFLDGTLTARQIEDAIDQPSKGKLPGKSATLQLLLGQVTRDSAFMSNIPIGQLISTALAKRNRDAWHMLVPLYQLINHEGLRFAQQMGLDVLDTVDELGMSGHNGRDLDSAVSTLGLEKATLLVKLGVFEQDLSAKNVRSVAASGAAAAMSLLPSLGADPVSTDTDGETALLCEAGAPVAALDGDRNTTVSQAAAYGRKGVLEVLLRQDGAKGILNERNKYGKAAMHYAKNKPEIVAMPVRAGADPDLEIGPVNCHM